MHCNKITSLDDPCSSKDAANKQYVDNLLANFRSATIAVGDIANRNENLSYNGALTSATISSGYGGSDAIITAYYSCRGYVPCV